MYPDWVNLHRWSERLVSLVIVGAQLWDPGLYTHQYHAVLMFDGFSVSRHNGGLKGTPLNPSVPRGFDVRWVFGGPSVGPP